MSKCVGCGIRLQTTDENKEGYVSSTDYSLCERCFRIKFYSENRQVENRDSSNVYDVITDDDLVVYVSSMLTLDLEDIDKYKNVLLVLTKRDVIPKSVKDNKIIEYVKKNYNIENVIIVSANKKKNLDVLYNKLCKVGNGKKIYFVGATNSGKSTLINELINSYGNNSGNITTSMYPNTTMDIIEVKLNDLVINDTPGIVNEKSIINVLSNKDLKRINSKNEIKPITFQIKDKGSILVDELFRVDYETSESSLTFYVSNSLSVKSISIKNDSLSEGNIIELNNLINKDVVIADIGYIKITKNTNIKIICKDNIDVKIRDNLI